MSLNYTAVWATALAMKLAGTTTDAFAIRAQLDKAVKQLPPANNPNSLDGVDERGGTLADTRVAVVEGGKIREVKLSTLAGQVRRGPAAASRGRRARALPAGAAAGGPPRLHGAASTWPASKPQPLGLGRRPAAGGSHRRAAARPWLMPASVPSYAGSRRAPSAARRLCSRARTVLRLASAHRRCRSANRREPCGWLRGRTVQRRIS